MPVRGIQAAGRVGAQQRPWAPRWCGRCARAGQRGPNPSPITASALTTCAQVVLAVRADEACHSHVNHTFSELKTHEKNPFSGKGSELVA